MGKKLLLSLSLILVLALSLSTALNMNLTGVSAAEYPAVMVVPESVVNPDLTPGTSFTVSIYTDYEGEDVWGWQFTLSFNADVLHGVEEVTNGELISDTTMFSPGTFDNEAGTLSLTGNFFLFGPGETPPTTNGPGTLAYVTFTVVGYGTSDITLGDETQLKGYNIERGHYKIVDGVTDPYNLGHGYFDNTAPPPPKGTLSGTVTDESTGQPIAGATVTANGCSDTTDASGQYIIEVAPATYTVTASKDGYYDSVVTDVSVAAGATVTVDFALEPVPVGGDVAVTDVVPAATQVYPTWTVPLKINVTVKNVGSVPISGFTVSAYYDENLIDTVTVAEELGLGGTKELTISWDLSGVALGVYTIKANATLAGDVDTGNNECVDGTVIVAYPGDCDNTGFVDLGDAMIFLASWFKGTGDEGYDQRADFDGTGFVDLGDAMIFLAHWFTGP